VGESGCHKPCRHTVSCRTQLQLSNVNGALAAASQRCALRSARMILPSEWIWSGWPREASAAGTHQARCVSHLLLGTLSEDAGRGCLAHHGCYDALRSYTCASPRTPRGQ
jgi:hypothetical protein